MRDDECGVWNVKSETKPAVLISIRPYWVDKIASGAKTVEIRKTRPKMEPPFRCYIYETRGYERVGNENLNCVVGGHGRGAIVGEFVCDQIEEIAVAFKGGSGPLRAIGGNEVWYGGMVEYLSRLSTEDICRYIGGVGGKGYAWHITGLRMYERPRALSEFEKPMCVRTMDCGTGCRYFDRERVICKRDMSISRAPQSWMYAIWRGEA